MNLEHTLKYYNIRIDRLYTIISDSREELDGFLGVKQVSPYFLQYRYLKYIEEWSNYDNTY